MKKVKAAGIPRFIKQVHEPYGKLNDESWYAEGFKLIHDIDQFPKELQHREIPK